MDYTKLIAVLRDHAAALAANPETEHLTDTIDLVRVLAHLVDGKPIHKAFGAPGDWGYSSPIGKALNSAYSGKS